MSDSNQPKLIQIELTRDELGWLRNFLYKESISAEIDHENVESLHTDAAIHAAKVVLNRERAQMEKIVELLDKTIRIVDTHESLSRQITAMTPPVA